MKRFLTILLLLALLLCSCTSGGEEQTTEGETTAAAATEPAETEPEETAAAHEAKTADGFRFSMTPAETVTEASGEADVSLRNSNSYTVAFESCFYTKFF